MGNYSSGEKLFEDFNFNKNYFITNVLVLHTHTLLIDSLWVKLLHLDSASYLYFWDISRSCGVTIGTPSF